MGRDLGTPSVNQSPSPLPVTSKLGEQFILTIQPFVYRRYLDESSITEIKLNVRQTKARIESQIREQGDDVMTHVKLGIGGIRDIEFTLQCLQLIPRGPHPSVTELQLAANYRPTLPPWGT